MKKIPKIWLLVSIGLFATSASCSKNEVSPDSLEFVCQGEEKTLQTYTNEDAVVRKINIRKRNPKQTDATKSDFLYSVDLYILTLKDPNDASKTFNLVPSTNLSSEFQVDNLSIKFSGDKKNCTISTLPLPNIDYLPTVDFTIGNKIILSNLQKK
jgi:hypothetical protein